MVRAWCLVVFFSALLGTPAKAVLVYDGTAANLAAPTDDPGWAAVATISATAGPASAVFLGNNGGYAWFLTANHVSLAGGTLSIGGGDYTVFSGVTQIGTADLKVFRLNTSLAGIDAVTLATSTPTVNTGVTMIGNGRTGTKVTWDTSTPTWTSPGTDAEGYTWSTPNVKQWGTNTVLAKDHPLRASTTLATSFDAVVGEAQGSRGDSGGAVFHKEGLNWQLAALIVEVGRVENDTLYEEDFTGQPPSTSVASIAGQPNNKSVTFSVQIANYRSGILAAIPEPGTFPLAISGIALLAFLATCKARKKSKGAASCLLT